MKIRFEDIPAPGLRIEIDGPEWVPADELRYTGPVTAGVLLERRGERVFVSGEINLTLVFECDRCLESFLFPQHLEFNVDIELADKALATKAKGEYACKADEMEVVFLDEPVIDIHEILYQQVLLAMPGKKLCTENCPGLCSGCGANLKREPCHCSGPGSESPFAVLGRLKH